MCMLAALAMQKWCLLYLCCDDIMLKQTADVRNVTSHCIAISLQLQLFVQYSISTHCTALQHVRACGAAPVAVEKDWMD